MVAELRRASAALLESPPLPPAGLEELARRNARRHTRRRALTGAVVAVLAVVGLTVVSDGGPGRDERIVTVPRDDGALAVADGTGVVLVPANGDAPVRIELGGQPVRLEWSADGAWLAVEVADHLVFVSRDGQVVRRIAEPRSTGFHWSPTGNVLGVWSLDGMFTITPDGAVRRIRATGGGGHWSPDGRRLSLMDGDGIHVIDADGSDDRLVSPLVGIGLRGWSPDGRHLLYRDAAPGANDVGGAPLVSLDIGDGSTFDLGMAPPRTEWVQWLPDRRSVLFVAGSLPPYYRDKVLRRCDLVAEDCLDVTTPDHAAIDPALSPDGKQIAYVSGTSMDDLTLRVVDVDGSDDHVVEGAVRGARLPSWAGEGTAIVHQDVRGLAAGPPVLVVDRVPPEGGEPERLARVELDPAVVIRVPGRLEVRTAWSPAAKGGADPPR